MKEKMIQIKTFENAKKLNALATKQAYEFAHCKKH